MIPTNQGEKTPNQIMSSLMYGSYAANRDNGMTHEALLRIGIGNEAMKLVYEQELKSQSNN